MPRERTPLKRIKTGREVIIKINDLWRNPDTQNVVIKNIKKIK